MDDNKKKLLKYAGLPMGLLSITIITIALLLYNGIIFLNDPSYEAYPVRGIDVSRYQSPIDWDTLSKENINFAYIKATEGSSYIDPYFSENWENANTTNLYLGAYHFFSIESNGKTQAENFIANVPYNEYLLPPVIDLEFYGKSFSTKTSKDDVKPILDELIKNLNEHYGKNPIIYVTSKTYQMYISGDDDYIDNPIWIRSVIQPPTFNDNAKWTIWQYTNRQKLNGYSGEEKFIDMNTYNGSLEDFIENFKLN